MADTDSSPTQSTCPDKCGHLSPNSGLSTSGFLARITAGTWDPRAESTSDMSTERATLASVVETARSEGQKGLTLDRKWEFRRQVLKASTDLLIADFVQEHSRKPTDDELAILQTEGRAILKSIPVLKFTWQEELWFCSRP